jgi:CRP-like cAMP-binding protein
MRRMLPRRLEALQRVPVFGALRADALAVLLDGVPTRHVAAGAAFFREGDDGDAMYVLERGRVAVQRRWRGTEHRLRELGPGDCFGEMALMDLGRRSASVVALEDCDALAFGPDHLLRLFERDPEQFALIQMNLGREVCRRLRATDELLMRHWDGDAPPGGAAMA